MSKKSMRIVFLLSFAIITFLSSCKEQEEGIKPMYRDVTEAVYSTVTVQPRVAYKVHPLIGGIIEEMMIEEGDEVKRGDIILRLTDNKSNVNVQNAKLKYEMAKESFNGESALLKELKQQINTARSRVKNDSINYERQKRLWDQNIGSRVEFDNRKLAFDISKNDLDRLDNNYSRSKTELQRQMEIAENTLKINQLNSEDFNVRSKIDGLVYSIEKEVGESVSSQTIVAIIGSKSDFILSLLIDEVDIRKVFEGQKVVLSLDAFPDETFEAKISKIYPEKDVRSLTFKVEADFVTSPDRLLKGLSGEANIVINEKEDVLTLPSQYISDNRMVNTKNGMVSVNTGLKSLDFTEILSGIDSSTIIKGLE